MCPDRAADDSEVDGTSPDEAYVKSVDKAGFETLLKRGGIDTRFIVPPAAPGQAPPARAS